MANEVDKYLLGKFKSGLEDKAKFALHSHFEKLLELLNGRITEDAYSGDDSIRHHLHYLNNILGECQTSSRIPLVSTWSIRNRLKEMEKEIVRKPGSTHPGSAHNGDDNPNGTQQRSVAAGSSSGKESQFFRWSSPDLGDQDIRGFDEDVANFEKTLVVPGVPFKAIGIVGIGGIGKTTLCQKLFREEKVRNHFAPRLWVSVSKAPNEDCNESLIGSIVKRMLLHLGVEEDVISDPLKERLSLLHQHLYGKRYLIVFDDVRIDDFRDDEQRFTSLETYLVRGKNWEEKLAYGLPKGHGGTVIVTSRSEEVVRKMVGPENLHRQTPLKKGEDCWHIFTDAAGLRPEPDDPELKKEITDKCKGVPLVAKVMGEIVKTLRKELSPNTNAAASR